MSKRTIIPDTESGMQTFQPAVFLETVAKGPISTHQKREVILRRRCRRCRFLARSPWHRQLDKSLCDSNTISSRRRVAFVRLLLRRPVKVEICDLDSGNAGAPHQDIRPIAVDDGPGRQPIRLAEPLEIEPLQISICPSTSRVHKRLHAQRVTFKPEGGLELRTVSKTALFHRLNSLHVAPHRETDRPRTRVEE
jgi:hypothetical protein